MGFSENVAVHIGTLLLASSFAMLSGWQVDVHFGNGAATGASLGALVLLWPVFLFAYIYWRLRWRRTV